jgi:hypothetical protein
MNERWLEIEDCECKICTDRQLSEIEWEDNDEPIYVDFDDVVDRAMEAAERKYFRERSA